MLAKTTLANPQNLAERPKLLSYGCLGKEGSQANGTSSFA
jgi:hypothetical protein